MNLERPILLLISAGGNPPLCIGHRCALDSEMHQSSAYKSEIYSNISQSSLVYQVFFWACNVLCAWSWKCFCTKWWSVICPNAFLIFPSVLKKRMFKYGKYSYSMTPDPKLSTICCLCVYRDWKRDWMPETGCLISCRKNLIIDSPRRDGLCDWDGAVVSPPLPGQKARRDSSGQFKVLCVIRRKWNNKLDKTWHCSDKVRENDDYRRL